MPDGKNIVRHVSKRPGRSREDTPEARLQDMLDEPERAERARAIRKEGQGYTLAGESMSIVARIRVEAATINRIAGDLWQDIDARSERCLLGEDADAVQQSLHRLATLATEFERVRWAAMQTRCVRMEEAAERIVNKGA